MRRVVLTALALALLPLSARADEMCDALDKVWAAAPTFESLRGEERGLQLWAATVTLPGTRDCVVAGMTDGTYMYDCRPELTGLGIGAPDVKAFGDRVAACSPEAVHAALKDADFVYFGYTQRIELMVWPDFADKYRLNVYP